MKEPLISVIVPIYKVEKYLYQCIDSLLAQDFTDYEAILVDDGSPDRCPEICDEYAKVDGRVKVIHKWNGGLSDARNAGMEQAGGSYLWFLDGDDWLTETSAFHIVANRIQRENADVVFFSYKKFYEQSGRYSGGMFAHVPKDADIRECIRANAYKGLPCNKVVRRALVVKHNMRFPVGFTSEDLVWCADLLAFANKIVLCKNDLMAYRQRVGSITGTRDWQARKKHLANALVLINKAVEKYSVVAGGNKSGELIGHYLAYEFSWLLGEVYPFWNDYSEEIRELAFLLDYNLCEKVAKVRKLKQVIGLKRTAFVLNRFIRMRKLLRR